jgi:hypothetical protein
MVMAALVFFPPASFRAVVARLGGPGEPELSTSDAQRLSRPAIVAFVVFVAVQVLVPLRAHAYGGDVRWHEQGMRFAWKVMVREKNGSVTYRVVDPRTGRATEVPPRRYLTSRQERDFATQPDLILRLAHHIADDFTREGLRPHVFVDALVSLNGRPAARLIDPSVDLASVRDGLGKASWILPAPSVSPPRITPPRTPR